MFIKPHHRLAQMTEDRRNFQSHKMLRVCFDWPSSTKSRQPQHRIAPHIIEKHTHMMDIYTFDGHVSASRAFALTYEVRKHLETLAGDSRLRASLVLFSGRQLSVRVLWVSAQCLFF